MGVRLRGVGGSGRRVLNQSRNVAWAGQGKGREKWGSLTAV